VSTTVILAVSNEPELLESRSSILRSAGYDVEPVLSVEEAIDRLTDRDFDLVLLCHSIPAQERSRLIRLIRGSRLPTAVVSVTPLDGHPDEFADATVDAVPEELLSGIRELLLKARKHGSGSRPIRGAAD
jgi:CheY-like chemotaxis protein